MGTELEVVGRAANTGNGRPDVDQCSNAQAYDDVLVLKGFWVRGDDRQVVGSFLVAIDDDMFPRTIDPVPKLSRSHPPCVHSVPQQQ